MTALNFLTFIQLSIILKILSAQTQLINIYPILFLSPEIIKALQLPAIKIFMHMIGAVIGVIGFVIMLTLAIIKTTKDIC